MPVTKPYRPTCRPFKNGSYATGGKSGYIHHALFATAPQQYIRAFLLLQKDLHQLFEFKRVRRPFEAWGTGASLPWYEAYNATKHDRHLEFERATFECVVDAVAGLLAILSAQFHTKDFDSREYRVTEASEEGIGEYFIVRFPKFPAAEQYEFDWQVLANQNDPFANLGFP